jgi:hypothetical protein
MAKVGDKEAQRRALRERLAQARPAREKPAGAQVAIRAIGTDISLDDALAIMQRAADAGGETGTDPTTARALAAYEKHRARSAKAQRAYRKRKKGPSSP